MGGIERGLTRGARKVFENHIFSEVEDLGKNQKIQDWVGVCEKSIVGSRR